MQRRIAQERVPATRSGLARDKDVGTHPEDFGFLDRQQLDSSIPLDDPQSEQAALDTTREGIVLLKNDGNLLPLQQGRVRSVAVVGPAGSDAPPTGFGSSTVFPISYVPELDGIESEAPAGTEVDFISDCTPDPTAAEWQTIDTLGEFERGLQGQYFTTPDLSGTAVTTRVDNDINFDWEQDPIPVPSNQGNFSAKWTGQFIPQISGDQVIKVCADGGVRVLVNGQILIDNFSSPPLPPLGYGPTPAFSAKFSAKAGTPYSVELDYHRVPGFFGNAYGGRTTGGRNGSLLGVQLSWASLQAPPAGKSSHRTTRPTQRSPCRLIGTRPRCRVSFTVTNTGKRAGAEVAELYVGQQRAEPYRK